MNNSNELVNKIEDSIKTYVPDFENLPEESRGEAMFSFYELSKREGLNYAGSLIDECGPYLMQLQAQLGQQNSTFKKYSNKFVDTAVTLILMQVNGNLGLSMANDLNQYQKRDLVNQNSYTILLVNKLERFYKTPETQSEINRIKNKVGGSEQRVNPSASCYVATFVYGSYDCFEVCVLREYRDRRLSKTFLGRFAIRTYYTSNKFILPLFQHSKLLQKVSKFLLDAFVKRLNSANMGLADIAKK